LKPSALLGALVGAAFGTGLWAAVALITGYEIGIVAWAVGGMVGFGAHALGGRGGTTGTVCAILAVGSIFCGKLLGYQMTLSREMDSWLEASVTPQNYRLYIREVKAYEDVETEYDVQEYMVTFGYTEAKYPYQVTREEMDRFLAESEPQIKRKAANPPSYEEWGADNRVTMEKMRRSLSGLPLMVGAVVEDLNLFDLIFAFLGIATAFRFGASGREPRRA
jgi:hypothetical protein